MIARLYNFFLQHALLQEIIMSVIFKGMALHHMLKIQSAEDYKEVYQNKLVELAPILDRLGNVSQIIWLNQYPTLELQKPTSKTIHNYNKDIRHIFKYKIYN